LKILNSFRKKISVTIIILILCGIGGLLAILLPTILITFANSKNKILRTLNSSLETNFSEVMSRVDFLFSSTIEESIKRSQEILKEQSESLIVTIDGSLKNTSLDLVEREKQMLLESEQKRITDITKRLYEQLEIYLSELDYTNIDYTLNTIMQDTGVVTILLYERLDKIIFKKIRLDTKKNMPAIYKDIDLYNATILSDTGHMKFIDLAFKSGDILFRTSKVGDEYFLETAKSITASKRTLGLINISFSLSQIFGKISGNKKIFLNAISDLYNLLKINAERQSIEKTQLVKKQLTGGAEKSKQEIKRDLLTAKNKMISDITDYYKIQSGKFSTIIIIIVSVIGLILLSAGVAVALALSKTIARPLNEFVNHTKLISKGNLKKTLDLKTGDEFEKLAQSFNEMCSAIEDSNNKLAEWNKQLECTILKRTASIKNLLDNAGQGFLKFEKNLLIDIEYSSECEQIFKQKVENKKLSELIYPDDVEQKEFVDKALIKVLTEKNKKRRAMLIPLLPDEIIINKRYISFEYKIIGSAEENEAEKIMVILTDITEKRGLEKSMELEKKYLNMIVRTVSNRNDLIETLNEYKRFCDSGLPEFIGAMHGLENTKNAVYEIYRHIHTFKGNFAQFELVKTVEKLHALESELNMRLKNIDKSAQEELKKILPPRELKKWVDEDITLLKTTLGEDFFRSEKLIVIDRLNLIDFEKKLISQLSHFDCKKVLPQLRKLRYKSLKNLFISYPEFVLQLSERLEKNISPMLIEGEDIPVDLENYIPLGRSFVHLFRNIIEHGFVESIEERLSNGKNEYGLIKCSIKSDKGLIIISISDDGKGINSSELINRAVQTGLMTVTEANSKSENEILELIFLDGFTTKNIVSNLSGRGIGMSAVKAETEKIGGSIKIKTKPGYGSEFIIELPYKDDSESAEASMDEFFESIAVFVTKIFKQQLGIEMNNFKPSEVFDKNDSIELFESAVFIDVKGFIYGTFVLTANKKYAEEIAGKFIEEPLPEEEVQNYYEYALAEILNVIIGNSMKSLKEIENSIIISPPYMLKTGSGEFKFQDSQIKNRTFSENGRKLNFYFINRQT